MIKIGHINGYTNIPESVVTVGKFGVLHKGHEEILKSMKDTNLHPIVFSFAPSPALFFSKDHKRHGKIFDIRQTNDLLRSYFNGNYLYFLQKFNHCFSSITPEVFIKLLFERFNMRHLIVGSDFTFGVNKTGNINIINSLALKYKFNLSIVNNKDNISTTLLRNFLQQGKIKEFNNLIAFNEKFRIIGVVVRGMEIAGKVLGYKTANISLTKNKILPPFGVYLVNIRIDDKIYKGIANIGIKPTITNIKNPILEVHIIDFNHNIYGRKIEVQFLHFVREERKFENLEALKNQIALDIKNSAYQA